MDNSTPAACRIPAEMFDGLMERVENRESPALVHERAGEPSLQVNPQDLWG